MKYWFHILKNSKSLGVIFLLTFFITIMGLLSPIFIIHIFNRYIAFGLQGTLIFLLTGALAVAAFEYIFRNIRNKILSDILIDPIKIFKLDLIKTFFERENKIKKGNFLDIIDFNNSFFQFISPKIQSSLLDAFFVIFIATGFFVIKAESIFSNTSAYSPSIIKFSFLSIILILFDALANCLFSLKKILSP